LPIEKVLEQSPRDKEEKALTSTGGLPGKTGVSTDKRKDKCIHI
jgi:hypothetical protein